MNSHLPAIEVLSNPGLRDRHWEDIQSVMNIKFNFKEGTLRELLNKGVETYLIRIEGIYVGINLIFKKSVKMLQRNLA